MRVWITRYALTTGILEVDDAKVCTAVSEDMITVPSLGTFANFHGQGRDWHTSRPDALARAEEMRRAKIASLENQLTKFKAMTIEVVTKS